MSDMPKLFENLWAKLAALLLAFLLWFHVATDKTFQYETTLELVQVDLPDDLALSEAPPSQFTIIVTAPGKRLLRSDWKKSGLRLTIDRNRPGRFKIDFDQNNISLIKSNNIKLVNIISPRETILECDEKMQMEVPVKSRVVVVPDEGFALTHNDSLVPEKVMITGPQNKIKAIDSIETFQEIHEGARNSFSIRIPLAYPEIYGINIFPDTVSYVVNVSPIKTRVFSDIGIQLINVPDQGSTTIYIQPSRIEIRAGGIPDIIDGLKPTDILATADYNQSDTLGIIPVVITLPPAISMLYKTIDSVRIVRE